MPFVGAHQIPSQTQGRRQQLAHQETRCIASQAFQIIDRVDRPTDRIRNQTQGGVLRPATDEIRGGLTERPDDRLQLPTDIGLERPSPTVQLLDGPSIRFGQTVEGLELGPSRSRPLGNEASCSRITDS